MSREITTLSRKAKWLLVLAFVITAVSLVNLVVVGSRTQRHIPYELLEGQTVDLAPDTLEFGVIFNTGFLEKFPLIGIQGKPRFLYAVREFSGVHTVQYRSSAKSAEVEAAVRSYFLTNGFIPDEGAIGLAFIRRDAQTLKTHAHAKLKIVELGAESLVRVDYEDGTIRLP